MVLHGEVDDMITVPHREILAAGLAGGGGGDVITKKVFKGRGHYLPLEEREAFRDLVERIVQRTDGGDAVDR